VPAPAVTVPEAVSTWTVAIEVTSTISPVVDDQPA
jgi:hypothetical protein